MREMLEEKLRRFEELEKKLQDPEVLANSSKIAAVAREHGSLSKLALVTLFPAVFIWRLAPMELAGGALALAGLAIAVWPRRKLIPAATSG